MATKSSVLLVEDDGDTREMMAVWLRGEGYRVQEARDGQEALKALELEIPCAMVVDLHMPVMDGAELRRRQLLSAAFAAIPFILVSASSDSRRIGRELRVADIVPKPFNAERLLAVLATHCHCRHVLPSN